MATPVILCGATEQIGEGVIAGLKPDYEIVQFIRTTESCISEIPSILQGQVPPDSSSSLGTGNTVNRPVAIILGGGYTEAFDQIHDAVEEATGGSGVIWLKHDGDKPAPPLGPAYGKAMIQRVREVLEALKAEGKLGSGEGGVQWY